MIINESNRTHMRQTITQMKSELQLLREVLENAPVRYKSNSFSYSNREEVDGYDVDEYLTTLRLETISELAKHLLTLNKVEK